MDRSDEVIGTRPPKEYDVTARLECVVESQLGEKGVVCPPWVVHSDPTFLIDAVFRDDEPRVRMHAIWAVMEQVDLGIIEPYRQVVARCLRDHLPCVRIIAVDAAPAFGDEFKDVVEVLLADMEECTFWRSTVSAQAGSALKRMTG